MPAIYLWGFSAPWRSRLLCAIVLSAVHWLYQTQHQSLPSQVMEKGDRSCGGEGGVANPSFQKAKSMGGFIKRFSLIYIFLVDSGARNRILGAIQRYHQTTCIRWTPRTNQRAYVHIVPQQGWVQLEFGTFQTILTIIKIFQHLYQNDCMRHSLFWDVWTLLKKLWNIILTALGSH